jgi:hypothetical protein
MSEIHENKLFVKDENTNALIPLVILSDSIKEDDRITVKENKIYKIDEETNALIPVVTGISASGDGSYSLDEIKTADTWIDGKPIYKKTFKIKSPKLVSSTVATDYDTGIFIDVPIRSETVFYHTDPTVNSGNVYYNSAGGLRYMAGQYKSNATNNETLRVYVVLPYATSSSAFSECDVYITSYYTKIDE